MRKTRFQRITAFALALVFLFCGVMSVGAASSDSSTNVSTSDIRELLNAISYNQYLKDNADVPAATEEVVINAYEEYVYTPNGSHYYDENGFAYLLDGEGNKNTEAADPYLNDHDNDALAGKREYDSEYGLYVPGNGTVSWNVKMLGKDGEILPKAKYSIVIDYYPVENKSAAIERIFMVNGAVPFAEARYLTISKIWKNVYSDGYFKLPEGESVDSYVAKAAELGITAFSEERDDGTYIIYKMPDVWTKDISELVDAQSLRFFTEDIDRNEIRASLAQAPKWTEYEFKDSNGYYQESFEFVLDPDENGIINLSLESVNEPIAIRSIKLVPHESYTSYEKYISQYANAPEGSDNIKIESEYFHTASSQTIYPIEDRSSAITSPSATDRTVLNTIGGEKWQGAGQWVTYQFEVGSSGLYEIVSRFRQNVLDGMFVSRALYIYSDSTVAEGEDGYYNGIPFAEAANLRFGFSSDWQSDVLNDGEIDGFKFYFKEGVVYTIKFEVTLGSMGEIVNTVQNTLDSINNDYLSILKLTGSNPDEYRDYGFNRIMPDVMIDLIVQSRTLQAVAKDLSAIAGDKSSMTATLEDIARLLENMGTDEDNVAKSLEELKTDIGSLGTWLGDAKTQPLQLDFITVQPESAELPEAEAGFWKSMVYEFTRFFKSFFRNYDRMGALEEVDEEDSVEVWLATGRDQSQVMRSLINNGFTPKTNIAVNLKLVTAGTLLPSILSGMGPDVYIGLSQSEVINYAIRGALINVEDREGFRDIAMYYEVDDSFQKIRDENGNYIRNESAQYNEAAMMVLGIEDANGDFHYYGLPEAQDFNMMFVREDVLAELDIDIPRTWDDVLEAIPVLQANNMLIGMHTDYKVFLYQKEGELYADNGMRINLDSNVALDAFNTMCNMFTMYSFPYKYDFANRFRTGEMPIGFASYTATYNQLKVFATEIEGLWGFYPLPGYADENGDINNVAVSTVTAIVMITGCNDEDGAWEFMKWHSGAECQAEYSNEMVALIGPSAKHSTANINALDKMPWTDKEYTQLALQFNNLASIPNYPGSYIIDRYTNFAFLAAFNDKADPVTELQSYITTINKEITRKRGEFELETLDYVGQTLAQKRMSQATAALEEILESSSYSEAYDAVYDRAINAMDNGDTEDYASLRSAADALAGANAELFADAIKYIRSAADSLESYEAYK